MPDVTKEQSFPHLPAPSPPPPNAIPPEITHLEETHSQPFPMVHMLLPNGTGCESKFALTPRCYTKPESLRFKTFLFSWFCFSRVSLHSTEWPGIHYVSQAGLDLREIYVLFPPLLGLQACAIMPANRSYPLLRVSFLFFSVLGIKSRLLCLYSTRYIFSPKTLETIKGWQKKVQRMRRNRKESVDHIAFEV